MVVSRGARADAWNSLAPVSSRIRRRLRSVIPPPMWQQQQQLQLQQQRQNYNYDFYGGAALWCSCTRVSLNLENQDLDRQNLRSMLKISYGASLCLSQLISVQFALEMCLTAQNCQKLIKPPFWRSKSSKLIEFGGNREPVYDFILVINSNLGPISHRYWDTATYWLKMAILSYPSLI